MNWEPKVLGDLIETKKGFAFKSKKYVESGVPIVRVSDFTMESISSDDLKYYPYEEKDIYLDYELHEKDIIIQTVGSWQNNPASVVGKVVHVPYFLDGALLNQNAVKIIPIEEIDRQFLYYRLKMSDFKGHVLGEARGAANQASITLDTIKSFKLSIPSYNRQKKIGDILSEYDDLIENNQKQIKLLEEAAYRLYKEWFMDLHFPGYEKVEVKDGIPIGWNKKTLEELCDLRKKTVKYEDISSNTPYIGLEHMPRKDFCLSEWGLSSEVNGNKSQYVADDIIFGKIRPYFHKVGFALTDGVASTDTFIMIPHKGLWSLVLLLVSSDRFVDYSYQTCKEGAKMPRADWNQLKLYETLVANDTIQSKFESYIFSMTRKIKALALQIKDLKEARDRLLPKLMTGEIEV